MAFNHLQNLTQLPPHPKNYVNLHLFTFLEKIEAGLLLAVLCLWLPFSIALSIVFALPIFASAIVVALLRS